MPVERLQPAVLRHSRRRSCRRSRTRPLFRGGRTTADIIIETLITWSVPVIFGMVGDGIGPLIEAISVRQDRIRYIGVGHEEAAAFMACGYAKHTGRLGASECFAAAF
jgi:hypothetical protein